MHKMQEEKANNEFDLVTLSRHVLHNQALHKEASGDLTLLLVSIQVACKYISSKVRRAGLVNLYSFMELITLTLLVERDWRERPMFRVKR